ncbi:hypothetical protein WNZ15_26230, partial [Roseibium sp. AS2]
MGSSKTTGWSITGGVGPFSFTTGELYYEVETYPLNSGGVGVGGVPLPKTSWTFGLWASRIKSNYTPEEIEGFGADLDAVLGLGPGISVGTNGATVARASLGLGFGLGGSYTAVGDPISPPTSVPTLPSGSVSSMRAPGQFGPVQQGFETNALDVLGDQGGWDFYAGLQAKKQEELAAQRKSATDVNGPETVVDLPTPHYAGKSDGGSSYGNPDAGSTPAASAAAQNTSAAKSAQSISGSSSTYGDQDAGGRSYSAVRGQSGGNEGATRGGSLGDGTRGDSSNNPGNNNYSGGSANPDGQHSSSYGDRDAGGTSQQNGGNTQQTGGNQGATRGGDQGDGTRGGPDPSVCYCSPVLLDLDGDGLEVTALDRSTVFLDTGGDGFLHRTAWAGEGDGVLYFDPDERNEITEKRQFVFTEWDPTATSDLEALASVFDSNGDGVLNAGDADFGKFKVIVTLPDGSTTSKTLAELGITEIDLTADASNIELSDGSVITGKTTFTRSDGTTGTVGDMLLAS